jgi:hypothetical protein
MFKLLILSADPSIHKWESLPEKLKEIKDTLKVFDVDVKYEAHTPLVIRERINHTWLNSLIKPHFDNGYDIIAFHFSSKQCKEWGIKGINGANPKTDDEMGDLYFWADQHTKRQGLSQFVQTCLHEIAHEYFAETKQKDITHEYHAPLGTHDDIKPLVASFDWNKYQPRRMALKKTKNLLETIVGLYKRYLAQKPQTGTKHQPDSLLPLVLRQAKKVLVEMEEMGLPMRIIEGYRSPERQAELYAQGRTKPGAIVTNAKPGQSLHQYGCACDLVFRDLGYNASSAQWALFGRTAERHGFEWGGSRKWKDAGIVDKPHIQLTLTYSLADFQKGTVDYNKFN